MHAIYILPLGVSVKFQILSLRYLVQSNFPSRKISVILSKVDVYLFLFYFIFTPYYWAALLNYLVFTFGIL